MRFFTLTVVVLLFSSVGMSKTANVFFIKKSLAMKNGAKAYHDIYLNAGRNDGLKKGMVIVAHRRIPFQDTGVVQLNEELMINIVELKLIHVQATLSVARVYKKLVGVNSPIVDYNTIMIGDKVNTASAKWVKSKVAKAVSKKKTPRKQASAKKDMKAKNTSKIEEKLAAKVKKVDIKNPDDMNTVLLRGEAIGEAPKSLTR